MQYLSHFVEGGISESRSKKPALFRRDRIKPNFKVCKKWHFLGAYEHIFGIIALEEAYHASTCFKIACQEILIKCAILGSEICFYIFVLLGNEGEGKYKTIKAIDSVAKKALLCNDCWLFMLFWEKLKQEYLSPFRLWCLFRRTIHYITYNYLAGEGKFFIKEFSLQQH